MNAKGKYRRSVLARRAQYLRDVSLPAAGEDTYAHDRVAAELGAIRWALRVIDEVPDVASALAHYPVGQCVFEEDRVTS